MSDSDATRDSVTVAFRITEAEFIRGCQRGYRHSVYMLVLVPTTIAVAIIAAVSLRSHNSTFWFAVLIIPLAYWPWFVWLQPRSTYSRKSTVRELRTITYSATGSHHQGESYSLDRPWSRYTAVHEYPDMYLLRYRGGNTNTLPKRAFLSQSDEGAFRTIASAHLKCHFLVS